MAFYSRRNKKSVEEQITLQRVEVLLSNQTKIIMSKLDEVEQQAQDAAADLKQAIADKGKEMNDKLDNLQQQISNGQPVGVLTNLVNELKGDAAAVRAIGAAPVVDPGVGTATNGNPA
jgi:nucleotide-binding universal stress UspA family protein